MSRSLPIDLASGMMGGTQGSVLYVYGVFDGEDNWSSYKEWIDEIVASGVTAVVFSTFHVDMDGNLYGSVPLVTNGVFNPASQLNPDLPSLYQTLSSTNGVALFYSIGNSAGTTADMCALQSILADPTSAAYANLQNNLGVLTSTLSIVGIDFDFEPASYTDDLQQVVSQFTTFCWDLGLFVTYCPYTMEDWWVGAQIKAVQASPQNIVLWWNVQCYPDLQQSPADWISLITQNATAMNVAFPPGFIVAGTSATLTPSEVESQFSEWAGSVPGMVLGFVWQFGNMTQNNSVASYMSAVAQGLENPSSTLAAT